MILIWMTNVVFIYDYTLYFEQHLISIINVSKSHILFWVKLILNKITLKVNIQRYSLYLHLLLSWVTISHHSLLYS